VVDPTFIRVDAVAHNDRCFLFIAARMAKSQRSRRQPHVGIQCDNTTRVWTRTATHISLFPAEIRQHSFSVVDRDRVYRDQGCCGVIDLARKGHVQRTVSGLFVVADGTQVELSVEIAHRRSP
jgi:hypothetical protein